MEIMLKTMGMLLVISSPVIIWGIQHFIAKLIFDRYNVEDVDRAVAMCERILGKMIIRKKDVTREERFDNFEYQVSFGWFAAPLKCGGSKIDLDSKVDILLFVLEKNNCGKNFGGMEIL